MTSVLVGEAISVVYAMFLALTLGSAEFQRTAEIPERQLLAAAWRKMSKHSA
jgi:hypothetical protein